VVLLKPDPARRIGWRARYVDPDSGRTTKETLDAGLRTAELRDDWAVRKAKALTVRRLELDRGAPRATGTSLGDALDRYFKDHERLRKGTLGIYRRAADKLASWGAKAGVRSADDLTGPHLVAFRASLVREPLNAPVKGGKRGKRQAAEQTRAPTTVNSELRAIGTVLGYLRRLGLLPKVSSDDLSDGLAKLASNVERLDYRKPAELRKLLEAALRHDADTFQATREEHAGKREPGTTQRYTAIAPFVAAAILTGMRSGELIDLDWKQVDLEALDHDGRPVGEIYVTAASKTHRARTVGLEISPLLRALLAALKLKTGGKGSVFGITRGDAKAAERRLRVEFGAPDRCNWQALRRSCGTFLTNAPGIFGAASAYRSAKQLGHSVAVAERHYVDVARGIQREARNLESAMQIEAEVQRVIDAIGARPGLRTASA
jgi:integrase